MGEPMIRLKGMTINDDLRMGEVSNSDAKGFS
jgi:hypothetical protein